MLSWGCIQAVRLLHFVHIPTPTLTHTLSHTHTHTHSHTQSSYSSDTGDFIREATEQLSYYADPYSYFAGSNIPSEDEIAFSFASGSSSHHSLLVVVSPTPQEIDEEQNKTQNDGSVMEQTRKDEQVGRQRKVGSVGESTVQIHCDEQLEQNASLNDDQGEADLSSSEPVLVDKVITVNDVKDDSPKQQKRRERRHAVVTARLQNPLEIVQLNSESSTSESKEDEGQCRREEPVTKPRQRKTYSAEARLHNPLIVQQDLETIDDRRIDEVEPVPTLDVPPPAVDHQFDDTLEMSTNSLTRPGVPGEWYSRRYLFIWRLYLEVV